MERSVRQHSASLDSPLPSSGDADPREAATGGSPRGGMPRTAAALLTVVSALLLVPVGVALYGAVAGTPQAGGFSVPADTISDSVAATAGQFRVDESGSATYSIPLFTVAGTAGVVPQLSLNYSSQAGVGPLGKGWTIGGISGISRCRATREAGDFISGGVVGDGSPAPVNFTATDRYCLDGQRLLPSLDNVGCTAVAGMTAQNLRTEIQSFQRVCAYTPNGGTSGVAFFTVERKDGSISWYGDRDNNTSANRPDGYVNATAPGKEAFALSWAQTRFQDSTGNYIDFSYHENANGAVGEHLLHAVKYTGRTPLPGQTAPAQTPFAQVVFLYQTKAANLQSKGYVAGGIVSQAHRLYAVQSEEGASVLRYYQLNYATSASGSGLDTLTSVRECRDNTLAVCAAPTNFTWSAANTTFATKEYPSNLPFGDISKWKGFKQGDLDGDGRQDIVYIKEGNSGAACPSEYIMTAFSVIDGAGRPGYVLGPVQCTTPPGTIGISGRGDGGWHLLDYNGDGRDDLFISSPNGQPWRLFLSTGRGTPKVFDETNNVIAGLSPAISSSDDARYQLQLADLNGDSLTDVIYHSNGLKARLMERSQNGFAFGNERNVQINSSYDCGLCMNYSIYNWVGTNYNQLYDLNSDGSSDLLFETFRTIEIGGDGNFRREWHVEAFNVSDISETSISFSTHHRWLISSFERRNGASNSYTFIKSLKFADANSDQVLDAFSKGNNDVWSIQLNTGSKFLPAQSIGTIAYDQHMQLADVNGDGRADVVHPNNAYSGGAEIGKKFFARLAQPDGTISGATTEIGDAFLCEGYNCDPNVKMPMFSDLDGDGNLDFMSLKLANNPDLFVSRSATRYVPRDTIVKFANGLGAETDVVYAPLTLKDFYRSDTGSRNGTHWGRGAPVSDLLAPMYAVQQASSTSANNANPTAKSTVHYRYNGAKMQAGGRGFLGFREVVTVDPNQTGGYVVTKTQYGQNFPYIGMPLQTVKSAALGQVFVAPACLTAAPTDACFAARGQPGTTLGGTAFSQSTQSWEAVSETGAAFAGNVQAPIYPRTAGTVEAVADPYTATQTSWVQTAFTYGSYGNVTQTVVDTFPGTSGTAASTVITQHSYSDNPTLWRLGRLTASTVTHRRPGVPDVVRNTSFAYAMSGAATGLLTEERTQPGGDERHDLRKAYVLDDYGNRVASFLCSNHVTNCTSTAIQYDLWNSTRVHRYGRQEYDSRGRYPTRTIELFRPLASSDLNAQPVETVTTEVLARDAFGNVTEAVNVNQVRSVARYGTLGRAYYAWQQTDPANTVPNAGGTVGATSLTTYRWCGTAPDGSQTGVVACPAHARYRVKTSATSAPTQWVYYDRLGREVMKAAQTFNVGVSGKDATAVCTEYDAVGRASRVSTPFFLSGTTGSGEPGGVQNACSDGARKWTLSEYDVLGRVVRVTEPNNAVSTIAYNGLTTTRTNARNIVSRVEVKNAMGELAQSTDAAGLTTTYGYSGAGDLFSISRNAGRGAIVTTISYDMLGRKIGMVDPDAGNRYMGYNAAGEMTYETDGTGRGVELRYDFRGRKTFTGSYFPVSGGGTTWEHTSAINFDSAPNGIGQENCSWSSGYAYATWVGQNDKLQQWSRCNTYDAMGRIVASATYIDGVSYSSAAVYDDLGRTQRAQDPSGKWLKTEFGSRGHALRLCESSSSDTATGCASGVATTYLENQETDIFGNTVRDIRGGSTAMQTWRQYDPLTGRGSEICAGSDSVGCQIMRDRYVWDGVGNMVWRDRKHYGEDFWYDAADRFEISRINRNGSNTYAYGTGEVTDWSRFDKLGNVCAHFMRGNDATSMNYNGRAGCGLDGVPGTVVNSSQTDSPHQVRQSNSYGNYLYDHRGNQTFADANAGESGDRTIRYTSQDQAYEILKGNPSAPSRAARFWYDPDGKRYKREDTGTGIAGTRRTLYVSNIEIVTENGITTYKRYIGGVLVQNVVGGTATNRYLFQDHLGSVTVVTDANGVVQEGGGFNAFGERRFLDNTGVTQTALNSTTRGFTGHEMVDGLDVVHMNGRIYDPTLGRFLQPDPVIQETDNPQNWNAYTYVFNNPYKYTDPSGMISESVGKFLNIVGIVLQIAGYIIPGAQWLIAVGKVFSMVMATYNIAVGIHYGGFKGGLMAAFGNVVGHFTGGMNPFMALATNMLVAGVSSMVMGGNFAQGAMGALKSAAINFAMRIVVGGTVSAMTGGKYGTPASSGKVESDVPNSPNSEDDPIPNHKLGRQAYRAANKALMDADAFRTYKTQAEAENKWASIVGQVQDKYGVELGSHIYQVRDGYVFGPVYSSGNTHTILGFWDRPHLAGAIRVGFIHTHPDSGIFSGMAAGASSINVDVPRCFSYGRCGGDLPGAFYEKVDAAVVYQGKVTARWDYETAYRAMLKANGKPIRFGDYVQSK